jgi:ferritin
MMSQTVLDAINKQINSELAASYTYLAMSAWCEQRGFTGSARWLRMQSQEEHTHAMRLFDFMLARNAKLDLKSLEQPRSDYRSLAEVFETAFEQEKAVSGQIEAIYELVFREKAYPAVGPARVVPERAGGGGDELSRDRHEAQDDRRGRLGPA